MLGYLPFGKIKTFKNYLSTIFLRFCVLLSGIIDSKTFDVTLMIALLRNLTTLTPPINGYDNLPVTTETTPASDLARIKHCRNLLSHLDDAKVDGTLFTTAWMDISGVSKPQNKTLPITWCPSS